MKLGRLKFQSCNKSVSQRILIGPGIADRKLQSCDFGEGI